MKIKSFNFIILCLLVLGITVIIAACNKDEVPTSDMENLVPIQIDFTTPLPATVVSEMVSKFQDISVFQAQHVMHMGGMEVTGMVGITDNDFSTYEVELPEHVQAFKADMLDKSDMMSLDAPKIHNGKVMQPIDEVHNAIRNYQLSPQDTRITSILGVAEKDTDLSFFTRNNKAAISVGQPLGAVDPAKPASKLKDAIDTYIPFVGYYFIYPSQHGEDQRYVKNYFAWEENDFEQGEGYEHDFTLNNSPNSSLGPGTYLNKKQYIDGVPNVNYAAAGNMSGAYLDTRFMDPSYYKSFTIGTGRGPELPTMTWVWTYIRTDEGNADVDNAEIGAQYSISDNEDCSSTWCMFSEAFQELNIYDCPGGGSPWCSEVPGQNKWYFPED